MLSPDCFHKMRGYSHKDRELLKAGTCYRKATSHHLGGSAYYPFFNLFKRICRFCSLFVFILFPVCIYLYPCHYVMLQSPFCVKDSTDQWQILPPSCSLSSNFHFTGEWWTIHTDSFCVLIPRRKHPPKSSLPGPRGSGTAAAATYMEWGWYK